MGTISTSFASLTPGFAASSELRLLPGQTATYSISGTTEVGVTLELQSSVVPGCWGGPAVSFAADTAHSASGTLAPEVETAYRWRILVAATKKQDAAIACTITDQVDVLSAIFRADGQPVVKFTEDGRATDAVAEKTTAAGVTVDGVLLKDGAVTVTAAVQLPMGVPLGRQAVGFGKTSAEGLQIAIAEETVSFAGNAALFKATTLVIPAGAVILSAQANVESALTGGGTTTKVGLGLNASNPDAYGLSSVLTKNAKISTILDWAVLSGAVTVDICSCADNGSAGNTALTVGSVRVRVVYAYLDSLASV